MENIEKDLKHRLHLGITAGGAEWYDGAVIPPGNCRVGGEAGPSARTYAAGMVRVGT